jgi:quinol-cytochrome oxidoreductase complex cytochrome b subunit
MTGWGRRPDRGGRRLSRPVGCLVWIIGLILLLLLLSALFGGFQKGSRVSGDALVPVAAWLK